MTLIYWFITAFPDNDNDDDLNEIDLENDDSNVDTPNKDQVTDERSSNDQLPPFGNGNKPLVRTISQNFRVWIMESITTYVPRGLTYVDTG